MASNFPQSEERKSLQRVTKPRKVCSLFPFWPHVLLVSFDSLCSQHSEARAFPWNSQAFSYLWAFAFTLPSACVAPPSFIHVTYSFTSLSSLLKCHTLSEVFFWPLYLVLQPPSWPTLPILFVWFMFSKIFVKCLFVILHLWHLFIIFSLFWNKNIMRKGSFVYLVHCVSPVPKTVPFTY